MPPNLQGDLHQDHVWSTSGFDDHSKMARWTGLVSEHMVEMQVGSEHPRHFQALWRQYGMGPIELNFIDAGPQRILRSPQMVSRGGEPTYELVFMQTGSMIVRYRHEEERVPEGGFTLLRNSEAYEFLCAERSLALTAHINDRWLRRWLAGHESFSRAPMDTRRDWGGPLGALLTAIARNGLEGAALPRPVIADQIGSLFALMTCGEGTAQTSRQRALLSRIRTLMREQLDSADLDPARLARQAAISKRHLHGLFARQGTTFGRELIEMRLDRARQMLEAPQHRGRTVTEIALACGFLESSHFARRFRERFGVSPSSYRSAATSSGPSEDGANKAPGVAGPQERGGS